MKKSYVLTLEDDDAIYAEPNLREKIFSMMPLNKETIASLVAKSVGTNSRRALQHLSDLEADGYLVSRLGKVRQGKSHTHCRIFKRIK
jgi:predicted ArsR family transcriptional regulator|tara:strand:- start:5633 stop:5896 length:264 start_codon:yes stop_codon:yes gene_type:complete